MVVLMRLGINSVVHVSVSYHTLAVSDGWMFPKKVTERSIENISHVVGRTFFFLRQQRWKAHAKPTFFGITNLYRNCGFDKLSYITYGVYVSGARH